MIGTPISHVILALQNEGIAFHKKYKGDKLQMINHALMDMMTRDIITGDDMQQLQECFADSLSVVEGKANPGRMALVSRKRYAAMLVNHKTSPVARSLAELCNTVIVDVVTNPDDDGVTTIAKDSTTIPHGSSASVLLWGAIGASVGGGIGGPLGAGIGAIVGGLVGSCGGDTTVTAGGKSTPS